MDFKPTLWKIIISILGYFISLFVLKPFVQGSVCGGSIEGCSVSLFEVMINPQGLIYSLLILVLIYIIWSLFQKK